MSKVSQLTEISVPALDDLLYVADFPISAASSKYMTMTRAFGLLNINSFRLTTESLVPVSQADRTAQGTLYLTPTVNSPAVSGSPGTGLIRMFDGTRPRLYSSAQVSLPLSGLVSADVNYDVFVYDNGGVLTPEVLAWTNATTRATALVAQGDLLVKNGQTTRNYVGTIRGTGSGTIEDSKAKRFVWNYFNRVPRRLHVTDPTLTWVYSTDGNRQANANAANQIELVVGVPDTIINARLVATVDTTANNVQGSVAIGEDSTSTPHAECIVSRSTGYGSSGGLGPVVASLITSIPVGYHKYVWLESGGGSATVTWNGTRSSGTIDFRSGLHAVMMA